MKEFKIFTISFCLIVLPLINSKQMYSFEEKGNYIEAYNLNHFLQYPTNISSCFNEENNRSSFSGRNYNHLHLVFKLLINNEQYDIASYVKGQTTISLHHSSTNWYSLSPENASHTSIRQTLPPPLISSFSKQNSILLI